MSEGTVSLHIRLMGTPEVSAGGLPLVLNHLKSHALLFYLAATGQSHTRDHLATLLWGESGQSEAYHSLRSSLYYLRQALRAVNAEGVLISDGDRLGLTSAAYECDVPEFWRLIHVGDEISLSRAVKLLRGQLLQGFSIPDATGFDEWVRTESANLNQACFTSLDRLAGWSEEHQDWTVAIGHLKQMTQIDPLSESTQQRLIKLFLKQGEVGSALRQYRQFEKQLKHELGIAPAAETRALYEDALRQQKSALTTTNASSQNIAHLNILPFVGRDDLLHELATISNDVQVGRGMTILIQGEGGIGKTRLINEFISHLMSSPKPWMILQGACSPFDDLLSHGPFIEALQNNMDGELGELLEESNAGVPDARGRFFWRVLQTIRSIGQNTPLLLFIDDLQWANSATLNLFGFLSMRLHHLPVMLIGTVQHADAIPALQRLITLGRRRHELRLLSLTPLTQAAITELLSTSRVSSNSVATLAAWLDEKSMGNPFVLSEILAQLRADQILRSVGESWQLDTTQWLRWRSAFVLPETTHDLVGWRLANLTPEARNLLDVLVVASQPMPESVLRNMPGLWSDRFPPLVDDLFARGLIREVNGGTALTLPHHLLQETLLHRLSNLRQRTIHCQLAEAIEKSDLANIENWRRQIAFHAVAGEDVDRARQYGMSLLSSLPREYTGAETVNFVQHLHDLLESSSSVGEMIRLTRALGTLHQSLGHLEVAAHWHQQTVMLAQIEGDSLAQAETHLEMGELALMSNDYHRAAHAAQDGLEIISDLTFDDLSLSRMLQLLKGKGYRLLGASLAMDGRDLIAAEEHLQQSVLVLRPYGNQSDLCAALFELGNVAAQRGELQRALEFYTESAHAAESGGIHYYLALARNNFAYHSLLLGHIDRAQESVGQGIKVAEEYDLLAALLHLYSTRGEIYLQLNQWSEAEESFHSGLALAEELASLERQAGYRGNLALAARGQRDFDKARFLLEEALALIADQGYWHLHTRLQLWLAETLLDQGQYDEAEQVLDQALAVARSQHRTLLIQQGEYLQTRLLGLREK